MNTQHFRPKYDIEQYLIQFSFLGELESFPVITVEVVSGFATDTSTFAGLPIIQNNDVFVRVVGGTAGCVYSVSCSTVVFGEPVIQKGLIAVMPTQASIPPLTPPAPLARFYTTTPYTLHNQDSIQVNSTTLGGVFLVWPMDEMGIGIVPLGGQIRDIVQPYTFWPVESIQLNIVTPLGGGIALARLDYTLWPPEDIETSVEVLGGDIIQVIIKYQNWPAEPLDVNIEPLGGDIV